MRKFNEREGINSFYGSDKERFQREWREEKIRANPPKEKPLAPRKEVAPEPSKPSEPIKKSTGDAALKVLTNKDLLKKISSYNFSKQKVLDEIWHILHKYILASDSLEFYDWVGPNDERGRWGKSKAGRTLAKTYINELRKWTKILDDLVDENVIEQYEEDRRGESYYSTDRADLVKPSKLPTKESIITRTDKWGAQLKELIDKLRN